MHIVVIAVQNGQVNKKIGDLDLKQKRRYCFF